MKQGAKCRSRFVFGVVSVNVLCMSPLSALEVQPTAAERRDHAPAAAVVAAAAGGPANTEGAQVSASAFPQGSVSGRVRGPAIDGLAGIRLSLDQGGRSTTAVTEAGGRYGFGGLAPGAHRLTVDTPGFESYAATIEVSSGHESVHDVVLTPEFRDSITVTATRTARPTEEVPAAVTVIGPDAIAITPMTNIRESIAGTPGVLIESSNQGYDARILIRGAGLKARYGVREVMVLLNGMPITDPDSLTRLDFVDTHLVERIEVVRGPNSTLWGINSTGGAINIITRSPFAGRAGTARLDAGSHDTRNVHLAYSAGIGGRAFFNVNLSRRQSSNDWREWNAFDSTQLTLQPSLILGRGWSWEGFVSYTEADIRLPGGLSVDPARGVDQWTPYLESGTVERTSEPWRHSSRRSNVLFVGSRLVKTIGKLQLKPLAYVNSWRHFHPVTARVNDADTLVGGVDLQADYEHGLGVFTGGVTLRSDDQRSDAYTYADVRRAPNGRILSTVSDSRGELMRSLRQDTILYGAYAQESLRLGSRWLVDIGVRCDRIAFDVSGHERIDYDWSRGLYTEGPGAIDTARTYTAVSPRVGVVFELSRTLHAYGSVSTGTQTPTSDELTVNPDLGLTRVRSYEIGTKLRRPGLTIDAAAYRSPVRDEVVQVIRPHGDTAYVNAGATMKKGLEATLNWTPWPGISLGGSYSYTDYRFEEFSEPAFGRNVDRAGNRLPYVPEHHYSLSAGYRHRSGVYVHASANTWGRYWMDNANTATYRGYRLVTDLSLGRRSSRFDFVAIVQNLFDERYAVEAQKDLYGGLRYSPASPRRALARVACHF